MQSRAKRRYRLINRAAGALSQWPITRYPHLVVGRHLPHAGVFYNTRMIPYPTIAPPPLIFSIVYSPTWTARTLAPRSKLTSYTASKVQVIHGMQALMGSFLPRCDTPSIIQLTRSVACCFRHGTCTDCGYLSRSW